MIGITETITVFTYGDNQSVLWNTEVPDYTLKSKSSVLAYHFVREGLSRKEWITGYIKTSENISYLMTKKVSPGQDRKRNIRQLMYEIYTEDKVRSF